LTKSNARCLICNADLRMGAAGVFDTRFGIGGLYDIDRCERCGTEQTTPVPTPEQLKHLYEQYYNFGGEKSTRYTKWRELFLFSSLYRSFLKVDGDISFHARKGAGRLLDVGCNEGRGLKFYKRNGFTAEGLELNETAAQVARARGYTVYTQTLETFAPSTLYDVVVLSNVLEHTPDPKAMLGAICRVLNPGGYVWISCPNNRSWLRTVFGRFWINWHVPFHIVHFSARSLTQLLELEGYAVTEMRFETPSLWAAHSFVARFFAKRGKQTKQLRNPFIIVTLMLVTRLFLFPVLWLGNRAGRGDCLVVVAQKK
jgi:2-polyprenyl-3-methyl-5-hydroxy-6-metoxy-1,4-benzoquinol methylase